MNRLAKNRILRVFISSTWVDLQPERQTVERGLQRMATIMSVGMASFGSRSCTPKDVCLSEVDRSDVYVGIFAHRYGAVDPESDLSLTELEYRKARQRNLPCLIYLKQEDVPVRPLFIESDIQAASKLKAFKDELKQQPVVSFFTRPEELATMIVADLHNLLGKLLAAEVAPTPAELLADRIRRPLEVMGYSVIQQEKTSEREIRLLCEVTDELGITQRALIGCVEGEIAASDVQTFEVGIRARSADVGMLISYTRIAPSAQDWANATQGRVQLFTLDKFYQLLVNFEPYINRLIADCETKSVPQYYIDLACTKHYFDEQARLVGKDTYWSIDHYIDSWLEEQGRNHISILGDAGTGKTWFCWHYAARQAKRYLADPEHNRIPILIALRDYTEATSIQQLITDTLINQYGLRLSGGYKAFEQINADGKLLLILDGFDEMVRMTDYQMVVNNFWELAMVVVPNSKVLLTCRTAYFRYADEARKVLGGEEMGQATITLPSPKFEVIHIQEFNDEQIIAVLQKRLGDHWQTYWERIKSTYDLANLSQCPAILNAIVETQPRLISFPQVNQATLYKSYTDLWLQKDVREERTFLSADDKHNFIQELAWEMYQTGTIVLHYSKLPELIKQHFRVQRDFAYDLRFQSFLVRDVEGNYRFAHKSFLEFFVAKKLAAVLGRGMKQKDFRETVSMWGRKSLSPEVAQFLRDLVEPEALWMLIEETKGKMFEHVKYAGGNAATVLSLQRETFAGRDISKTIMVGAGLAEPEIAEAKKQGAMLEEPTVPIVPSFDIPETLLRALKDDRCIVFVGSGVSIEAGLPSWGDFMQQIIERLCLDAADARKVDYYTLFQIASDKYPDSGRFELVEQLIKVIDVPALRPSEAHRLIAHLPITRFATTNYDTLLDLALVETKGNVRPVVSKYDLPHTGRVILLKLHGDIKQVGSLVLTRDDYLWHREQEKEVFETLRNWLTQMPSLFLGFSHRDPDIMSLIDVARLSLRQYRPPIFTVELEPSPLRVQELKSKRITPVIVPVGKGESKTDKFLSFLRFLDTCLQAR